MSSSNSVRVTFIAESVYGITPGAGNFKTARVTSESLTGSPETTESQQIRQDRQSSGQVVTGLTVGGDLNFELAKAADIDALIEGAMFNTWQTSALVTVDLTLDVTAKTIERASGNWNTLSKVGDVVTLSGFADSENNTQIIIIEIVSDTVVKYAGPDTMVDETGSGTAYKTADKIEIGTTKKSFSVEKAFTDLTNKAINYRGMLVSQMNLNIAHGEIITGNFSLQGNDHEPVDASADFMTDGRTIDAAPTSNSMNGSVDMPFLVTSAIGALDEANFCIQSMEVNLNNNLTPQTCISRAAPKNYNPGTAQVGINMSAYLSDEAWAILEKKNTQESFGVGFIVKNGDGFYGFYFPAIQVTFDDPASGGQNQDVVMSMSGVAKVGDNGEKAMVIYKSA